MTISDNGQGHCKSKRSSGPYQSITIETKLDISNPLQKLCFKEWKKKCKKDNRLMKVTSFCCIIFQTQCHYFKLEWNYRIPPSKICKTLTLGPYIYLRIFTNHGPPFLYLTLSIKWWGGSYFLYSSFYTFLRFWGFCFHNLLVNF